MLDFISILGADLAAYGNWKAKRVQVQVFSEVSTAVMEERGYKMTPCCLRTQQELHHMSPL